MAISLKKRNRQFYCKMSIEFINITKKFGKLLANSDVSAKIPKGSIHGLIGENGAGKSTLIKILAGQLMPDSGNILINGKNLVLGSTKSSNNNGIGILAQDPLDFANFTVLDSFFVGNPSENYFLNMKFVKEKLVEYSVEFGFSVPHNQLIRNLSIGERQQLELIRLLFNGVRMIILDEPTAGFSIDQRLLVFSNLKKLADNGYTIILVSHKLEEIIEICNRATIMRNGIVVDTIPLPCDSETIVKLMFGGKEKEFVNEATKTELQLMNKNHSIEKGKNFKSKKMRDAIINLEFFEKIDSNNSVPIHIELPLHSLIGIVGLQGSGADKFIQKFFASNHAKELLQNNIIIRNITGSILNNVSRFCYVPADRLERGLFPDLMIIDHVALIDNTTIINWNIAKKKANSLIRKFKIKGNEYSLTKDLSGGNQQRLMLGLIPDKTNILLLEQPTRGLDLRSATYIWHELTLKKESKLLTVFSSVDVDEIYNNADYIVCFYGDEVIGHGAVEAMSKTKIMYLISGNKKISVKK